MWLNVWRAPSLDSVSPIPLREDSALLKLSAIRDFDAAHGKKPRQYAADELKLADFWQNKPNYNPTGNFGGVRAGWFAGAWTRPGSPQIV
jgi:hypothetical protein